MEISKFIVWYLYLFILGVIGFSVTNVVFKNWRDRGYGLAKFLGLLITAIPLWFLSSLKLVQFNQTSSFVFLIIFFIIALILLGKSKVKITRYMVYEEIVFFIIMFIWGLIRATSPQIEGTEKMMNLAFMNSVDRSTFFPPLDPWFSGGTVNYYYIGHYLFVFLGKISGITPNFAYNLALITIIAHTFISLNTILLQFFKKLKGWHAVGLAFMGALFICFGGNMHYIYNLISAGVDGKELTYFFPDATRIISNTINEFPAYSIVLGDVHGHYLGMPFVVMLIAFAIRSISIHPFSQKRIIYNLIISPLVVVTYGINSWDFVTVNLIFLLIHIYQIFIQDKDFSNAWKELGSIFKKKNFKKHFNIFINNLFQLIILEASLLIVGVIIMAPYFLNFKPAVSGIGFVPVFTPVVKDILGVSLHYIEFAPKSELLPWALMWGAFIIVALVYGILRATKTIKPKFNFGPLFLAFVAIGLIIGVEFFFLKDLFYTANPPYFRTNSVFKFYYHAWLIFGLATVYFVYEILVSKFKKWVFLKPVAIIIFILLFSGSIIYIKKAVTDFYPINCDKKEESIFTPECNSRRVYSLDGNQYIRGVSQEDYEMIQWINSNVTGQPVIVEAVGEAYTYYSRYTTNTGIISIMGWPTHEWQWRGDSVEVFNRSAVVGNIYEGIDIITLKSLIKSYNVEYVVIGGKEREKYKNLNESIFDENFQIVAQFGETKLYKVSE